MPRITPRAQRTARLGIMPAAIGGNRVMVEWAEQFAAEMLRLGQGRPVYTDMLDWAFELWPVWKHCDPEAIARVEFRNMVQDE
jgi:hypothetical protein